MALVHADQSQAYDRVSYSRLLIKLYRVVKRSKNNRDGYFSVTLGYLCKWLDNRQVRFRGQIIILLRGLPQGSPLSCLAYVVYYDFETKKATLYFFADDILLFFSDVSWDRVEKQIVDTILELETWCKENDALLNHGKSYIQFLHRLSTPLTNFKCPVTAKPVRSLGIWWDRNFNFSFHVSKICAALKAKAAILSKLRNKLNFKLKNLTQIYKVYRATFLCGGVWVYLLSNFQFNRMVSAFNTFTRSLFGFNKFISNSLLYSVTGLPSLTVYFNYYSCVRRHDYNKHASSAHWFTKAIRDNRQSSTQAVRTGLRPTTSSALPVTEQ